MAKVTKYIHSTFAATLVCVCLLLSLAGCAAKYNTEDFIGKTSAEIISEHGVFDCTTMSASDDGLYKNCRGGYTIKEAKAGFFGTSEEVLFFISFDENGIATECAEGYRPGG